MDFNATIDLIIKDLQEAREIIDDLKKYPGVPVLQVELAKSKCKSAGEVISLLKQEEEKPKPETEKIVPVTLSPKPQAPNPNPVAPGPRPLAPSPRPQAISNEPITESSQPKAVVEKAVKKSIEGTIIGDSFSHLSSRFNEQLGSRKPDDDLTEMMKTKSITSLTEAIGINDRFFFIREIFDDNKNAYSQAITKLESVESITDARAVIMSYTGGNEENEAIKQLLDLVRRKLPSNE